MHICNKILTPPPFWVLWKTTMQYSYNVRIIAATVVHRRRMHKNHAMPQMPLPWYNSDMKDIFSSIATRYDRMNRIMSLSLDRRWRRKALDAVKLPHSQTQFRELHALDLACGTGDFTVELLKRFPGMEVTGIDLTPEMIDIAKAKTEHLDASVDFAIGDAQDLGFICDETFDLIVCAFGFRNFPDKAKALAECARMLKPSGKLVVLELFRPRHRILGIAVSIWLSLIAHTFCGRKTEQYAYLRHSIATTASPEEFAEMARSVGLSPIERRTFFPSATALVFCKAMHTE